MALEIDVSTYYHMTTYNNNNNNNYMDIIIITRIFYNDNYLNN